MHVKRHALQPNLLTAFASLLIITLLWTEIVFGTILQVRVKIVATALCHTVSFWPLLTSDGDDCLCLASGHA